MALSDIRFVIITGLSGAGKTEAMKALEDNGFFCVDNLPPALIPKLVELCRQSGGNVQRVAMAIDIRGGEFFNAAFESLEELDKMGIPYHIVFLEATDEVLVRRFKETRRRHPLAAQESILEGIQHEREELNEIRGRAHFIIDTSFLSPKQLRQQVLEHIGPDLGRSAFVIMLKSFGFKYGIPLDADMVLDVRFLPNPQYVERLRELDGNQEAVIKYIFKWPIANEFMNRVESLLDFLIPHYINEGKTQLVISIGCTGGQHRSVAVANQLAEYLRQRQNTVIVQHRDVDKRG